MDISEYYVTDIASINVLLRRARMFPDIKLGDTVQFVSKLTPVPVYGIVSEILMDGIVVKAVRGTNEIVLPRIGPVKVRVIE